MAELDVTHSHLHQYGWLSISLFKVRKIIIIYFNYDEGIDHVTLPFQVTPKSASNLSQLDINLLFQDNCTNVRNGCRCFKDHNQEW